MIRQAGAKWYICYDADGSFFDGPFTSRALAEQRFAGMKPVDRMLVGCQGPALNTDAAFLAGTENGRQFEKQPAIGEFYRKVAEKEGVSVTGKVYKSSLASYPGDPRAWVSGRGDVQRLCEERGLECSGAVKVKGRPPEEAPNAVDVAPDIVEREFAQAVAGQTLTGKQANDAKAKIKEKLKPSWKK